MSAPSDETPQKRTKTVLQKPNRGEHPADARLSRLKHEVLPIAPYILSSAGSFKPAFVKAHYPQNEINWNKYSLFSRGEEELQYLTFKDRTEDREICGLYTRGGWDDGKGGIAAPEESFSRTSSDGTPKQGQAPKRKITLSEYKNKDRSKASPAIQKPTVPELKEGVKGNDMKMAQTATVEDVSKAQQAERHGQKRSADAMTGTKDPQSFAHPPSSPSPKKARVTPEESTAVSRGEAKIMHQESKVEAASTKLKADGRKPETTAGKSTPNAPPGRSQTASTMPDPKKPTKTSLPPMLGPLSPRVEAEIARLTAGAPGAALGVTSSTASLKTPPVTPSKVGTTRNISKISKTPSAEKPTAGSKLPKSATSTKGPQEQKQVTSAPRQGADNVGLNVTPRPASYSLSNGTKASSTPTPKTTPPDAPKRIRLRVVLKIKKKGNKKTLTEYLRMKPTPGRNSLHTGRATEQGHRPNSTSDFKPNGIERNNGIGNKLEPKPDHLEAPKNGVKRGKGEIDEDEAGPSAKRMQTQKPSTPKPSSTSSPAVSNRGSAQKSFTSTPSVEPNGTAMRRAGSGQVSGYTPQQPARNNTPEAPDTGRKRSSYTSPAKPVSEDLLSEGTRYNQTATTLKHDADVFLNKGDEMTNVERMQSVAIGTESVLCFMLAFTLKDTAKNYCDRHSWNSILQFLLGVTTAADKFGPMNGLLLQLEGVIRDFIAYADMQLLDKNPLNHNLGKPIEDPSRTKEQRKAAEYHAYYHTFHKQIMKAQNAWRSGWMLLDVSKLPSHYPDTWAQRDEQRLAYGKGRDSIKSGEYERKYNLPMGNMTSGLEAVNFGLNILAEWTKAEEVNWKPKLVL